MGETKKPNWIDMGTFFFAVATGLISAYIAVQSAQIDRLTQDFAEFRARSEIRHRLIILDEQNSCALETRKVQLNVIWRSFFENNCREQGPSHRIAVLALSTGEGDGAVFAPRVTLTFAQTRGSIGQEISSLVAGERITDVGVGLLEEGMAQEVYIPLAIIDNNGNLAHQEALYPLRISWDSPVTGDRHNLELNWFAPRDAWISTDAGIVAQ